MNATIAAARPGYSLRALVAALALLPWIAGCGASDSHPVDDHGHSHAEHGDHDEHGGHADHGDHDEYGDHGEAHDTRHEDHAAHGEDSHGSGADSHGGSAEATATHSGGHAEQPATEQRPVSVEAKIKIKSGAGKNLYSIKWKDDGAKLVDADEKELARYNVSSGGAKLKIKDPEDNVIGYLVGDRASGRIKVEDSSQEKELFKLIRQEDGDWKLEDAEDNLLVRVKVRDYGAELESASDVSLYKVKLKDGKTSLRNALDATTLYTNSPVQSMSFACMGFDPIRDVRIRAALLVQMQAVHAHH